MNMHLDCQKESWIPALKEELRTAGYAVVQNMVGAQDITTCREGLYRARDKIIAAIGEEKLKAANEYGVLRLILKYEPYFLTLLANPHFLAVIDATLSNTAILHLQNGFILPSFPREETPDHFQNHFHRDFPRYLNGYVASVNILLAVDDFTAENGATTLVPATHQQEKSPSKEYIAQNAISVECPAGAALVFDSTLWHASGINVSGRDRLAINHQFTRSFFKQQIDYVRALGDEAVRSLPERTQQLLGYYTRVPCSLEDYYKPEHERIYRKGQG